MAGTPVWLIFAVPVVALAVLLGGVTQFLNMPALFLGHIVAMMSCWCFMVIGASTYSMSSTVATDAPGKLREKTRMIHGVVQSLACLLAIIGYMCIFRNHQIQGASQFGLDPGNSMTLKAHVFLGYIVVASILMQGFTGWRKWSGARSGKMVHTEHPLMGRLIVLLAGINITIILTTFQLSEPTFLALVLGVVGTSVVAVYLASPAGKATSAREHNEEVTSPYLQLPTGAGSL